MASQQQSNRQFASTRTNNMPAHVSGSYQSSPTESYPLGGISPYDTTDTTPEDNFQDSGYFKEQQPNSPSPIRPYDDFVLYDSDPPFIDDDASLRPNHGSIYDGTRDFSSSHVPKYTSYKAPATHGHNDARPVNQDSRASSQKYVYQPTQPDHPSLFGEFDRVPIAGPSPLHKWIVSPYRHEQLGVRYESLPPLFREDAESIRLTPEPASSPHSPKPRKSKSGSSKFHRRRCKH